MIGPGATSLSPPQSSEFPLMATPADDDDTLMHPRCRRPVSVLPRSGQQGSTQTRLGAATAIGFLSCVKTSPQSRERIRLTSRRVRSGSNGTSRGGRAVLRSRQKSSDGTLYAAISHSSRACLTSGTMRRTTLAIYTLTLLIVGSLVTGIGTAAALSPSDAPANSFGSATEINVLDHGVIGDGVHDDTAAIQAALDNAPVGAIVRFPDVAPGWYSISGYLKVRKPLTILGDGPTSGSEIRQTMNGGRALDIVSSDVTVQGMRVIGFEYGPKNEEQGISVNYGGEGRLSNVTIKDNWVQNVSGRGISLQFVDDFIVSGNHVEDAHYAGIFGMSVSRGVIDGNDVVDVGDPVVGPADHNSYPIVLSANPEDPNCSDVIIRDNVVRHSPVWTGIMNHGGVRILILDNEVYDADFLYANVWNGDRPSHDTSFINNYGESGPRNSLQLAGPDGELTLGLRVIGNRFKNASYMFTWNSGDGVISWNEMSEVGSYNGNALRLMKTTRSTVVAHNDFDGSTISYEADYQPPQPSTTPESPQGLQAVRSGDRATLTWDYSSAETHDSFYIEQRVTNGQWERLAFRPPNDPMWRFDAPSNPEWVPFDPLKYVVSGLDPNKTYEFRIRANNGEAFSGWSATAAALPARFQDVAFGTTFYNDIEWLAGAGITNGCNPPDNTMFCPNHVVTRGQMAAFLVRALGYDDNGGGNVFVDDDGSVFEDDVDRLATAGVARGCNPPINDSFCPDNGVTRAQMAAFLRRGLGAALTPGPAVTFTDDDGSVFEEDIEWLTATGITKGCNPPVNDRFCPGQPVTRAQMAAFLHRALG